MGNIAWTKSWSASDNGTVFGGADLQNIQNDITTVVNGGITNTNINASAGIEESKLLFNVSTGHDHDGSNSKEIIIDVKHYRKGLTIYGDDDTNVIIRPGTIELGGTLLTATTETTLAIADDYAHGGAANSSWCYVYVYDNDGSLGYVLSDEAPDLSDADSETTELPFRYQYYAPYFYRCIGAVFIDAAGDFCWGTKNGQAGSEGEFYTNFDVSNFCVFVGKGIGADQTFNTIWTPRYAQIFFQASATTNVNDNVRMSVQTIEGAELTSQVPIIWNTNDTMEWVATTNDGTIQSITKQEAGTAGGVTIDGLTDNYIFSLMVWSDGFAY